MTKIYEGEETFHLIKRGEKYLNSLAIKNHGHVDLVSFNGLLTSLMILEGKIIESSNIKILNKLFTDFCESFHFLTEIKIKKNIKIGNVENSIIIVISRKLKTYLVYEGFNEKEYQAEFIASYIYKSIRGLSFLDTDEGESSVTKTLELTLNVIPDPVALMSKGGDLLVYNAIFLGLKILPSQCIGLENEEKIEIDNVLYIVRKVEIENNTGVLDLFIFVKGVRDLESMINKDSIERDLGIITSSLAHELNNPIAGILAGISLVLHDDFLGIDDKKILEEMDSSARRCKDLINIFLGFSRINNPIDFWAGISEAFTQSLKLLRSRMIESNIFLIFKNNKMVGRFNKKINQSVLTIAFYLILNEILIKVSKTKLVTQAYYADEGPTKFNGMFIEKEDSIEIVIDEIQQIDLELDKVKLLRQLILMEGLTFRKRGNTINIE